jgi:glycosyltransferase involved in cell wall biosynthesis
MAARRYHIPLVLSYHNQLKDQHRLKQALFYLYNHVVEPAALRRSVFLLPVRVAHLHQVHPALRADSRVREVVNGVDIDLFRPMVQNDARKQIGLPSHVPIALFVGALDSAHRFKNVEGLLRAFASLRLPDALLLVVGDGNLRASLQLLATQLRLEQRVWFVGSRSPDRLVAFYNAANVQVLPSTDVESFGLVLLEAMACGTPVVASRLPGIAALLEDGVDGLLTPPGDEKVLAAALETLLLQRKCAAAMGQRAREKVITNYTWQAIGARLEQIYREAMKA